MPTHFTDEQAELCTKCAICSDNICCETRVVIRCPDPTCGIICCPQCEEMAKTLILVHCEREFEYPVTALLLETLHLKDVEFPYTEYDMHWMVREKQREKQNARIAYPSFTQMDMDYDGFTSLLLPVILDNGELEYIKLEHLRSVFECNPEIIASLPLRKKNVPIDTLYQSRNEEVEEPKWYLVNQGNYVGESPCPEYNFVDYLFGLLRSELDCMLYPPLTKSAKKI